MGIKERPLVVDLDGSLLKTDSLYELISFAVRADPRNFLRVASASLQGRTRLKALVGMYASDVVPFLPTHPEVLELIAKARKAGRSVYLATASGEQVAAEAAQAFGPFDGVISSSSAVNLKGSRKAQKLEELFGERGFDYVGNESADLPIFERAEKAFLVGGGASLVRRAGRANSALTRISTKSGWKGLVELARPHQWTKNFLLFVPVIGAQVFEPAVLLSVLVGLVAFSAVASALYVLNDLLDVRDDRTHPSKRRRPLASGDVSVPHVFFLSTGLALVGILVGFSLSPAFLLVLGCYSLLAVMYSLVIKRIVVLDVFALASLYVVRLVGGAVVAGVILSSWLMSFSFFAFLFLALAKRYVEIADDSLKGDQNVRGRGYVPSDSTLVGWAGVSVGVVSAMVLALYIEDRTGAVSGNPVNWLWATVPLWLYWVLRTWFKAFRSELDDDPVLYALRDRVSLAVGVVLVLIFVLVG